MLRNTGVPKIPHADLVVFSKRTLNYITEDDIREDEDKNYVEDEDIGAIHGACNRLVVPDHEGRVDLRHDPYCLRRYFRSHWHIVDDDIACTTPPTNPRVSWSDYNLYDDDESKPGLEVVLYSELRRRSIMISHLILSQLLLYRIIANFGHPCTMSLDNHNQCWEVELKSVTDPASALRLSDRKGSPSVSFWGSQELSNKAVQLLSWLFGDNIPHNYNYTLCGSVA